MGSYNVHEAKSNLSRLLQKTAAGEQVIIMRDGKPVAELIPYRERSRKRPLGFAAGQIEMAEGWERPMTEAEAEAFLSGRL
jgi:prevent-host-death family protein